jgi:hypothetical protein
VSTTEDRIWFIWVTSAAVTPRVDHAVTDEEMAAASTGRPHAVCGAVFPTASLLSPPLPRCELCRSTLRARQAVAAPAPKKWHTRIPRRALGIGRRGGHRRSTPGSHTSPAATPRASRLPTTPATPVGGR